MADLVSAAPQEVQDAAAAMGWQGPEKFKGDPERFVDAEEFIKRGETVLPIVKAQLATTREDLARMRAESVKLAERLAEQEERNRDADLKAAVEKQKAVEEAIERTKKQLAKANEAGDHEAVAELTNDLVDLKDDKKAADDAAKPKPAEKKEEPRAAQLDPEQVAWNAENTWFGTDRRKTSLALGIAQELREAGDTTVGKVFLNKVKAEMLKTIGQAEEHTDKVGLRRTPRRCQGRLRC